MSNITPSQTIGPFPHKAWQWAEALESAPESTPIFGQLLDGAAEPVSDGWIEAWCPVTRYWQRSATGEQGEFTLQLPKDQGELMITVFARGLTRHLFTFVCTNTDSKWLSTVPSAKRASLIAQTKGRGYRWDIYLQGPKETAFVDYR